MVFRPRRSPALIPASGRLMRGGFWSPSERVDVDHGQLVARGLDAVTIVMRLDEIGRVDRRPAGGGGSSGSPRCVRIFLIGAGSVMKAMSRTSPPQAGHWSGKSSAIRATSLAHEIREVSWERGWSFPARAPRLSVGG